MLEEVEFSSEERILDRKMIWSEPYGDWTEKD